MALNTTDVTLGKGKVLFLQDGTNGYLDLGNATAFNITKEVETLEHFSSREGPKKRDKLVVTQQKATGQITLDIPDPQNLNIFFMGDGVNLRTQASAAAADYNVAARLDKWVEILDGSGDPVYDIPTTGVTVEDALDAALTEGTDFELDRAGGLIRFFSSGSAVEGDPYDVNFAKAELADISKIKACQSKTVKGVVLFKGNPDCGKIQDVKGYASLTPSDSIDYIGEDFQTFNLNVEFEENAAIEGLFEHITRGVVTQA